MTKAPAPCCVPSKHRAEILVQSRSLSEERQRAFTGSIEEMVLLDGAEFLMGTDYREGFPADGEGPVRRVTVDGFYVDTYQSHIVFLPDAEVLRFFGKVKRCLSAHRW